MTENRIDFIFTGVENFEFILEEGKTHNGDTLNSSDIRSGVDTKTFLPYIIVTTDRHKNHDVASFFRKKASGGVTNKEGYPKELNFAIFGKIKIKMSGERNVYPEFIAPNIVLGQGSFKSKAGMKTTNNWWISGDSMIVGKSINIKFDIFDVPLKKLHLSAMVQKCYADVKYGALKTIYLAYTDMNQNGHEFTVDLIQPANVLIDA